MFPSNSRSGRSPDRPRARARSARTTVPRRTRRRRGGRPGPTRPESLTPGRIGRRSLPLSMPERIGPCRPSWGRGHPAGLGGGGPPRRPKVDLRRAARAGRRPARALLPACPEHRVHRDGIGALLRPGHAAVRGRSAAARVRAARRVGRCGCRRRAVGAGHARAPIGERPSPRPRGGEPLPGPRNGGRRPPVRMLLPCSGRP